jgi:cytochrome P450
MLGVPGDDHELFEGWTQVLNNRSVTGVDDETQRRRAAKALIEFGAYVRSIIEERRDSQSDDLVSQLIATEAQGEQMDETELVAMIIEMIGGGHDTTANTITNGVLTLLTNPDQFEQLAAEPELIPRAVEEVLRYRSPVQLSLSRLATEDVTYGGVTIPAGSIVLLALAGANRDPALIEDPDRFDVTRDASDNHHLSFGFGAHHCLGASLARAEVEIALTGLIARLPGLRLAADPDLLPYRNQALITAPAKLPVSW